MGWTWVRWASLDGTMLHVVSEYHSDGEATIEYANEATEWVNQNTVEWKHTRKGQRLFLPLSRTPPVFPLKKIRQDAKELKYCLSSPHTVKGFADDLSVFSSNINEHQSLSFDFSTSSQDLDLTLRPDKCISVIFNGNKMDHKITFSLANGSTRKIAEARTKILGKLIAGSSSLTKQWPLSWTRKSFQPYSVWMTDQFVLNSKYG